MPAVWNRLGLIQLKPSQIFTPVLTREVQRFFNGGVPGIVEWVQETETLGEILVGSSNTDGAHQRWDGMPRGCHASPVLVC